MKTINLKINKHSFLNILPYLLLTTIFIFIPLIFILISALTPADEGLSVEDNFNWIDEFYLEKIFNTLWVTILSTMLVLVIGFPFSFFLSRAKSKFAKLIALTLISSPVWLSLLIKLIGIKLLFDSVNGQLNSTEGSIYTIGTLVYLNLPIFILTVYSVVENLPENLLNASKDLGRNNFVTFFLVVIPYAKQGIFAGLFLTFITCFGATGITSFVNLSPDGSLIGDIIFDLGQNGLSNNVSLSRISGLCLVIAIVIFLGFVFLYYMPKKIYFYRKTKQISKKDNYNA